MKTIDHISLRFEDNDSGHDDLVLRLGGEEWRCDTYYLALDRGMLVDQEDELKVIAVLARLLEQWHTAVVGMSDGEVCYLPFDFSDQCTGWLRCTAVGSDLKIQWGWASIEGWSFYPSDVGELLHSVPKGFRGTGEEVSMSRDAFLQAIPGSTSASPG
jgi:hypothetical protein